MTTELGEIVKARRTQLNLTQEDLAERAGKSQRWVSNLETGGVKRSRIDTLSKLAKALDIPLERLVMASGIADSEESAKRVVGQFDSTVGSVQIAGDDPRVQLLDLLEGKSAPEVDSVVAMVRLVLGRTEEIASKSMMGAREETDKSHRRRTA